MRVLVLLFFLSAISFGAYSQDSRNPESSHNYVELKYTSTQLQAMREAIREHPYTKYYDRLIDEYHQRMKDNVKKYKVMQREMQKPQYSDPMYFGHKRKPKKRPVGKRKYCKECDIVH